MQSSVKPGKLQLLVTPVTKCTLLQYVSESVNVKESGNQGKSNLVKGTTRSQGKSLRLSVSVWLLFKDDISLITKLEAFRVLKCFGQTSRF